jgi:hypothetical protein
LGEPIGCLWLLSINKTINIGVTLGNAALNVNGAFPVRSMRDNLIRKMIQNAIQYDGEYNYKDQGGYVNHQVYLYYGIEIERTTYDTKEVKIDKIFESLSSLSMLHCIPDDDDVYENSKKIEDNIIELAEFAIRKLLVNQPMTTFFKC